MPEIPDWLSEGRQIEQRPTCEHHPRTAMLRDGDAWVCPACRIAEAMVRQAQQAEAEDDGLRGGRR